MKTRHQLAPSPGPVVSAGTLAATAAGLILILIPEPATTLTGAAIVTATWAPRLLSRG